MFDYGGLPMTIHGAMAAGIPSGANDMAAIPETGNAENGVLMRPGNVTDQGKAFSMEKYIRSVERICKEMLGR